MPLFIQNPIKSETTIQRALLSDNMFPTSSPRFCMQDTTHYYMALLLGTRSCMTLLDLLSGRLWLPLPGFGCSWLPWLLWPIQTKHENSESQGSAYTALLDLLSGRLCLIASGFGCSGCSCLHLAATWPCLIMSVSRFCGVANQRPNAQGKQTA